MEPTEQLETVPLLHTQEVRGSSPCAPTIRISSLRCPSKVICGASAFLAGDLGPAHTRPFHKPLIFLALRERLQLKYKPRNRRAYQNRINTEFFASGPRDGCSLRCIEMFGLESIWSGWPCSAAACSSSQHNVRIIPYWNYIDISIVPG